MRFLPALVVMSLMFSPAFAQSSTSCIPAPPGLVSWWPGEGTAVDDVGGNHGELMGGAAFGSGEVGQSFSFDGLGAYVDIPDAPSIFFANDQAFTLEAWFMPMSDTPSYFILKNAAYGIRWQGRGQPLLFYNGNNHYSSRTSWELGHWYHVAVVDDGSTSVKFYVDGVLDKSEDGPARNPNRFACHPGYGYCFSLQFGAWYEPLACAGNCIEFFQGSVDEVTLYGRALTAAEIQSIFAAGSQGKCSDAPTVCESNLQACLDDRAACSADLAECDSSLAACTDENTLCNTNLIGCSNDLLAAQNSLNTCTSELGACNSSLGVCNQNLAMVNAYLSEGQRGLAEIQRLLALPFGQRASTLRCSGLLCPDIMAVIQQLLNPAGQNYPKRGQSVAPKPANKPKQFPVD